MGQRGVTLPRLSDQERKARIMDRIRIRGGNALKGEIRISGAKNAALPLMCDLPADR